jgi:hypothetical protein
LVPSRRKEAAFQLLLSVENGQTRQGRNRSFGRRGRKLPLAADETGGKRSFAPKLGMSAIGSNSGHSAAIVRRRLMNPALDRTFNAD